MALREPDKSKYSKYSPGWMLLKRFATNKQKSDRYYAVNWILQNARKSKEDNTERRILTVKTFVQTALIYCNLSSEELRPFLLFSLRRGGVQQNFGRQNPYLEKLMFLRPDRAGTLATLNIPFVFTHLCLTSGCGLWLSMCVRVCTM